MEVNRRAFLIGSVTAAALPAVSGGTAAGTNADADLSVFLSDIHVAHPNPKGVKETEQPVYQNAYFEKAVDAVLAMRPRPKRVVVFGDVALWHGWSRDYETSRPGLDRLKAAGVEVTLTMGNHDHREVFLRTHPEYARTSPVPGRIVSAVDLGCADLLLLDSLDENPKGEGTRNGVAGTLDTAQQDWLVETGRAAKRPFLVGAHHPIGELRIGDRPLVAALHEMPAFAGYVHGHDHRWYTQWHHVGYNNRRIHVSACLPSTGWWGDIGFAVMRTEPERAVLSLVQDDFFFPAPLEAGEKRPLEWDDLLRAHRGAQCVFRYRT